MNESVNSERVSDPGFAVVGTPPRWNPERYVIELSGGVATVTYAEASGRRWGEAHVARLLAAGVTDGRWDEYPRFPVRGVIEGFYGRPWDTEQRLDMVRFLGRHRMNTFVYSPKDDVLTRRHWRKPYADADLAALRELVRTGEESGVAIAYGISPGLSIRHADPADTEALLAKLDQVRELGVSSLYLLLDDIPPDLVHDVDRAAYPDLVGAQVDLVGRVRAALDSIDPRLHLAVCGTLYHGRGDEPYLARLAAGVDPRIDLMWTGRAICSPELDLADAATFARTTSRPVLYWDNYPVNDVAMTAELHIGAYRGRDPHLHRFARGIIANPMERPEASKIALATVADYLWDPESYDPDASWRAAIERVAGPADAAAMWVFADNVRSSCLEESDAHRLAAALERVEFERDHGDPELGRAELRALAGELVAAADHLLGPGEHNTALIEEIAPWLRRFRQGAQELVAVLEGHGSLDPGWGAVRSPQVFGDVLDLAARAVGGWIDTHGGPPDTSGSKPY